MVSRIIPEISASQTASLPRLPPALSISEMPTSQMPSFLGPPPAFVFRPPALSIPEMPSLRNGLEKESLSTLEKVYIGVLGGFLCLLLWEVLRNWWNNKKISTTNVQTLRITPHVYHDQSLSLKIPNNWKKIEDFKPYEVNAQNRPWNEGFDQGSRYQLISKYEEHYQILPRIGRAIIGVIVSLTLISLAFKSGRNLAGDLLFTSIKNIHFIRDKKISKNVLIMLRNRELSGSRSIICSSRYGQPRNQVTTSDTSIIPHSTSRSLFSSVIALVDFLLPPPSPYLSFEERRDQWMSPFRLEINRLPFPSQSPGGSFSFPLQDPYLPSFRVQTRFSPSFRRRCEQTMKKIYQMDAPPERPFSIWGSMGVTQFAFQINPQTTIFIDPLALGEFFQTATSAQKRAVQEKLAQFTNSGFDSNERHLLPIQRIKTLAVNAWRNPRVQGSLEILGGAAEIGVGYGMTFASGLVAAPIGHVVVVHGIDHFTTGLYSVITGKHKMTATNLALQLAGVPPETSGAVDAGLSIAGVGARALMEVKLVAMVLRPKFKLPPPNFNDSYNRIALEEFKVILRAQMEKPYVVDATLNRIVDRIYKSHASIGSGSTAAAIRHELATGEKVFEKLHSIKGREAITRLERWLKNNPNASSGDRAAAENIIKDLKDALGE